MPRHILHKIQFLCKSIPKVEWSGALFYSIEGSIKNPATFKITLEDILPLDMGTAAYTTYQLDDRFIDYLEEDWDVRTTWKVGHIHSHNSMGVFFSGTDWSELEDNAPNHNFYLSLIVNNWMDFEAKVAFTGGARKEIKKVPYMANDEQGNPYTIESSNFVIDNDKLFVYDCEIISPKDAILVPKSFEDKVKKIMEPKPKPVVSYNGANNGVKVYNAFDHAEKPFNQGKREEDWGWNNPNSKLNIFDSEVEKYLEQTGKEASMNPEYDLQAMAVYNFVMCLFDFGLEDTEADPNAKKEQDTIEDLLELLVELGLSSTELATEVLKKYSKVFNKHWPKASMREFINIGYEAVDLISEYIEFYPEIFVTREAISNMLNKMLVEDDSKQQPAV